jgi:PPP4R2
MPNVDPFNFDAVKGKVFEQLDAFIGIPFTVQRLAELVTSPRRHYRRTDKFMRALEKNMLVSCCFFHSVCHCHSSRVYISEGYAIMPATASHYLLSLATLGSTT